ncbi:MAG: hypothetical protein M1818_002360 [Claussenomyces sp. TS43310]|nr:MAG: hypothetical protein M1818_002360 [Claussenomyces sp. TS43310]
MSGEPAFQIIPVRSAADVSDTITLFRAYAVWLDLDLTFQGFEAEMAAMPGKYAATTGGELLLARDTRTGRAIGCVGLRALTPTICEMKRLYVTPAGRGSGLGRALVKRVVEVAKAQGYHEMRLDTLPRMMMAQGLYRKAGFVETDAYYETPLRETVFLALNLKD